MEYDYTQILDGLKNLSLADTKRAALKLEAIRKV